MIGEGMESFGRSDEGLGGQRSSVTASSHRGGLIGRKRGALEGA